jgi:nucleotide-binding universal stress UspA family protein
MSYAVLMVYIEADSKPEHLVRLTASLADKFNATLVGLSAIPIHPPFLIESVVIWQATASDIVELTAALAAKEEWFLNIAGSDHRKLEWRGIFDFPTDSLAREARSADLVVIGQTSGQKEGYAAFDTGEALLMIGRPVLVVPDGVSSLSAEHVVIGWKETREARRAVGDALPFLHEATRVTIVEICEEGEERSAQEHLADVVAYLTKHRIKSVARVLLDRQVSSAAQLIKLAQDEGADLLVTGAYGHSRLGEWAFGGMTQDLLTTSPICCLMSH